MNQFSGASFTYIYANLISAVARFGTLEAKTRDLLGVQLTLSNPELSLLVFKKNWKWCFQEAFDRMSGIFGFDPEYGNPGLAYKYRPAWRRKLEKEEGVFVYDYAEPLSKGIPKVIQLLKKHKGWREAILPIWEPKHLVDQENFSRRPCTLTLHFIIRNKNLHLYVNMRSNDVVNLLPYDVFHHTLLQRYIAHEIGVSLGFYCHFATHMYYPKRRETPGRNYVEKVSSSLEKRLLGPECRSTLSIKSPDLKQDFINAIKFLNFPQGKKPIINSPLLKNMVNFIVDDPVEIPFTLLKS